MAKNYKNQKNGSSNRRNKPNKKYSNRKNGGNKQQDVTSDETVQSTAHDINDPSFYIDDPNVMAQTTNFAFRDYMGMPVDLDNNLDLGVAGIMEILIDPCIPFYNSKRGSRDGFNLATYRQFLKQTEKNKRPITYGPEDIGIPELCYGSLIALDGAIRREFDYITVFNNRNRLWPKAVMKSMGVTDNDVANLANLRVRYNTEFIPTFNSLPMYGNLEYYKKCAGIFRNVYLDQDGSGMAQTYYLFPNSLWKYQDVPENPEDPTAYHGPKCVTVETVGKSLTELIDLAIELCNALFLSTALLTIQGDLQRYAAEAGIPLYVLPAIMDSSNAVPGASDELNYWLDNATFFDILHPTSEVPAGYTPANDVLVDIDSHMCIYKPYVTTGAADMHQRNHAEIVNFWHDNPTTDEKVLATRLMTNAHWEMVPESTTTAYAEDVACCDWIMRKARMFAPYTGYVWANDTAADYIALGANDLSWTSITPKTSSDQLVKSARTIVQFISMLTQFDHRPRINIVSHDAATNTTEVSGVFGDLQYFTTLKFSELRAIHDQCMLGLFKL